VLAGVEVLRDAVQGDALAQEIHRSYTAYLQNQLRWAEVADRAYWQARYA
jgi:TRAP-type mannitol/chloroaromatic compound transport system substrate-binding protein